MRGVLKLKAAAPFSRPVNEEEVPGYSLAVQTPMDLGTVLEKLKNGDYTSLGMGHLTFICHNESMDAWIKSCLLVYAVEPLHRLVCLVQG